MTLPSSRRPAGVKVSLRENRPQSVLVVRDTGIGIRTGVAAARVERFRQGDASTTRLHGGMGLGLAIVRHLVESRGATIRAESEGEGRRAEFIVCLPTCVATPGEHDTMLRRLRATPTVYESCRSRALPGGIDDNDSVGA